MRKWQAAVLGVSLVAVVSAERLVIGQVLGPLQIATWFSGLVVVGCAISGHWFSLVARAGVAAAISWLTTASVLSFGPIEHSWGLGEALALGVLLAQVIRSLPAPEATGLGLALGTAAIVAPLRDENQGIFSTIVAVITLSVGAAFIYVRVLDAQRHLAVADARSNERLAIARELHDLVAHHITGVVVQANAIRLVLDKPDRVKEMLNDIEAAGSQAMAAMRRLVALLRDDTSPPLDPTPGIADISAATAALRSSGVDVDVAIDPALRRLRPDVAAGVHRIIREALTNVGKHAQGVSRVAVKVNQDARGGIDIEVTDNGRAEGAVRPGSGGFGLIGLRERVSEFGGTLHTGRLADGGWQLKAHLPAVR